MTGRVYAGTVDSMVYAYPFEQRAEEQQFIWTIRCGMHEIPRRQSNIIRTAGHCGRFHGSGCCGRMYKDEAMLVSYLVPLRVAAVDFCRAGIAVHRKHQRNRLSRILLDLFRHINIPFAHPAADFLAVVFHAEIGYRILCHAQVAAWAAHPAALPIEEILPNTAQQQIGVIG